MLPAGSDGTIGTMSLAERRGLGVGAASKSSMRARMDKMANISGLSVQTKKPEKPEVTSLFRVLEEGQKISDQYDLGEEIYNSGSKAKVIAAKRLTDGSEVVVKIRPKRSQKSIERTWRDVMTRMRDIRGSMHVLEISEIVEDNDTFYIIMPKCVGGELFDFLVTEQAIPEKECKRILKELLVAVGHLHKNDLIHRDIKPENVMFDADARQPQSGKRTVKLIDFDTCQEWSPKTPKSRRFVGTPGYIAPEALLGEPTPQSDLWSVGVIMYILMTGEKPWTTDVTMEDGNVGSPGTLKAYKAIKDEVIDWEDEPWPSFPDARDICQKLMAFKTEDRFETVDDALAHSWLRSLAGRTGGGG